MVYMEWQPMNLEFVYELNQLGDIRYAYGVCHATPSPIRLSSRHAVSRLLHWQSCDSLRHRLAVHRASLTGKQSTVAGCAWRSTGLVNVCGLIFSSCLSITQVKTFVK